MKLLLLLVGLLAFSRWRRAQLDASDRANGYGSYADVRPVTTT